MPLQGSSGSTQSPLIAAAIAACLLQLAIAPQISIAGGAINFMVVLAAAIAVSSDPVTAVYTGFAAGLFYDLTSSVPVGLLALVLTLASYLAANASFGVSAGGNLESLRVAGVYIVAVNLVYGSALFALGIETNLFYALVVHGLVSAVLETIVAVPFLIFIGNRVQQGVFGGRAGARKAYTARGTSTRAVPRKRTDSGLGRAGKRSGGRGKHSNGRRSGGKRSGGLKFK